MNKLTAIKIKYSDGTYSDEIPVAALAENVEWDNSHSLVDILGNVAFDTKGAIQDQIIQLFNSKVDSTDLNNYVNSTMKTEVTNWLSSYISPATGTISYDASLSIEGAAADAKAAGDAIRGQVGDLKEDLSTLEEKLVLKESINLSHTDSDWTSGAYVDNGSGAITANDSLSYSAKIPVNVGDVIRLYSKYGGTFGIREIRSIAAYDANNTFVRTPDAQGWRVNSYTVPEGIAFIILSVPTATQYMVVANIMVTEYEPWFLPYYVATYDFIKDSFISGELATSNLKNRYACALPKTKFRQTVGIPCTWYKSCMVSPKFVTPYVNAGYSRTMDGVDTFSFNTETANTTVNGYLWCVYDPLMNLLYDFDNNTGYGGPTVVKALNLSDCSLLAIGDSTIDQDHLTGKLLSYFAENNHTITLLGTLGSKDPLNKNEGRAGWTTADYMTNSTKNGYTNPFWNPTAEAFDFSYYMTQQQYSGVDFVVIQLGINDLYPSTPRYYKEEPNYSNIWTNMRVMIDSILAYNSGIKIIINLPTPPNSDPTKHYIPGFLYENFVARYNELALNESLKLSDSKVRVSYCHLILDPANDILDNVHPKVAGYEKMALEVVNQINCWQNGV